MIQKLEEVEKRYEELNTLISDPAVIANTNEWKKLMKEHSDLEDVVLKYREYKKTEKAYEEAKEMLSDPELKELAEIEMEEAKEKLPKIPCTRRSTVQKKPEAAKGAQIWQMDGR